MGTLFAGIIRAPMTSVFMIFEITQDYQILVPLMVANLLSFLISRRFQPTPVYHALLQQDHVHLPSPAARAADARWTAADVMRVDPEFIDADSTVQAVWDSPGHDRTRSVLIRSADGFIGLVTADQLSTAVAGGRIDEPIRTLSDGVDVHVHPDHPSDVVLERLAHGGGLLPVVSRQQAQKVLGVVTFEEVARFTRGRREASATAFE
jgi:CIC family chloride channel protein